MQILVFLEPYLIFRRMPRRYKQRNGDWTGRWSENGRATPGVWRCLLNRRPPASLGGPEDKEEGITPVCPEVCRFHLENHHSLRSKDGTWTLIWLRTLRGAASYRKSDRLQRIGPAFVSPCPLWSCLFSSRYCLGNPVCRRLLYAL